MIVGVSEDGSTLVVRKDAEDGQKHVDGFCSLTASGKV